MTRERVPRLGAGLNLTTSGEDREISGCPPGLPQPAPFSEEDLSTTPPMATLWTNAQFVGSTKGK
jgi:hypothetical protein